MIDRAMKNRLALLAAALLLTAGCAKVETVVSSVSEEASSGLVWCEELTPTEKGWTVVRAGIDTDAKTRSRIQLNDEGSAADVLWTAGDAFTSLFVLDGENGRYSTTFTTEEDGVSVASFTNPYNLDRFKDFHCFYPDKSAWGNYQGELIFGYDLPAEQTAVPGGIQEGLNRAYAHADQLSANLEEQLSFHNLTSLLKFRLSGEVASQVREVTFYGSGVLAGDIVFRVDGEVLTEYPGIHYYQSYSTVVLKGEFEAEKDYYIALWPRQLNGFRMKFADEAGNSTTKFSSKTVSFEASRIKDFGTIDLGDEFADQDDGSLDPVLYMAATEGTKPVTIAVIPEGFTKVELSQYELLAKSGINTLFETEPYKTYRNRFNVYILKVASPESGASITDGNGNIITPVASYFGARWGATSHGDMRADNATVFNFVSEKCPDIVDGTHSINEVPIVMIINDDRSGGMCWTFSNGRGFSMVPYTRSGDGLMWGMPSVQPVTNDPLPASVTESDLGKYARQTTKDDMNDVGGYNYGDWRNTLVHEFGGHCFGRLGDEYWSSTPSLVTGPVSRQSYPVPHSLNLAADPSEALWKEHFLDRLDELTAKDSNYGRIGLFQGGDLHLFGRWRSERISCMIDNRLYFSAWQRYLIVQRIFTLSGDLERFSFESWLAKDVTTDPIRDVTSSGAPRSEPEHRSYRLEGPLPPPMFVED